MFLSDYSRIIFLRDELYRGYLLFWGEYQIYFIEFGDKNHHTRWNRFGICPKNVNFLFILCSTEIQKTQPNFFLGCFLFDLTFAVCLLDITLGVNIENGLE